MTQLDENALNIYTDGSCYPSPRLGGVGYLFATVDEHGRPAIHEECPPGWKAATNNQMELQACIEAVGFALDRRAPFDLSKSTRS
jgi:ribonuclease HI